ncbi:AI-2E family transporter [Desulfuromonas versatilis]|uniref:AI-2E family transporter n=1 Tax=Desulfuromonas versatilis TaxID=2802975 RepID=A0ABM8HPK7_9BACT|nr:AI-2E family transporter [Desulfuromonas versatilis]BCR03641.1 AI-2E family transporter [Desulfuromonas versatilis]
MERKLFFALLTFAFLLFYLNLVFQVVAPFLRVLAWAAVIGILTRPVYKKLHAWLRGRDLLAACLMTPAVVLTVVVPMVMILLLLTQEVTQMYRYLEAGQFKEQILGLGQLTAHPAIAPAWEKLRPWLARVDLDPEKALLPAAQKAMGFLAGYTTEILKNFFLFLLKMMILVMALFFFYRDGSRMLQRFWSLVPLREEDRLQLGRRVEGILSAVIYGVFLTCVVQGTLGGIGFWICGLPSPVLFGVLMAIFALIPMVGTLPFWLPGAGYLLLRGEIALGIFLLCWGAFLVSSVDNVLRPLFISGRGKIPLLVVVIGVLGGIGAFGFVGVVLGPLILALALFVLDLYRAELLPAPRQGE